MNQTDSNQPAATMDSLRPAEHGPRRTPPPGHAAGKKAGRPRAGASRPRNLAPVTVDRLIRCHRLCVRLKRDGREFVSSREIGELLGCRPSLIRKDLSRLGKLGTRGYGYRVAELLAALEGLLGCKGPRNAVLIGAGALGAALLTHGGFARDGFRFVAAFDVDPDRVGTRCDCLVVNHVSEIPDMLGPLGADIGVLAIPGAQAQQIAELLAANGVRAILNLTPAGISPRKDLLVTNVDLGIELQKLAFYAADAQREPRRTDAASGDRRARVRPGGPA